MSESSLTRRRLLKTAAAAGFPAIVPSRIFGQSAPSNQIHVAQIGCGRIARGSEFPGLLRRADMARIVAVCDVDRMRAEDGRQVVEAEYARQFGAGKYSSVKIYGDYRDLLQDKGIDAVIISSPDFWHAEQAIDAALMGKDIYLEKPTSLTIREGRQMCDTLAQSGRVVQVGTQQRSELQFRTACELVRNGRIGKLKEIYIGLPMGPVGGDPREMPVPPTLNFDLWLGQTPKVYYTESRVHPQSPDIQKRYDGCGWMRIEQYCLGMITQWGTHHIDIAHWGMGMETSGPTDIVGMANFPKGFWNVHRNYHARLRYANGVTVQLGDQIPDRPGEKYPNGIRFIGEDGWIFVTRGTYRAGDAGPGKPRNAVLDASDPRILISEIGERETHLHASPSNDHHLDWLTSIKTRRQPVAPLEQGHRSTSAAIVAHAAMRLGRPLKWDPQAERFEGDDEANAMLSRPQRAPFGTSAVLSRHGRKPA
jgi:myo-inositol 2-dehydrogenase / D-chiro-inositol 1-dehydrogenase